MTALPLIHKADALLRPGEAITLRLRELIAIICFFGMIYGSMMGTFSVSPQRWQQPLYSAIKVPALLLITGALSLPSFFVFHTLLGLRNDFRKALAALLTAQAGLTIVLASLAPVTLVYYSAASSYPLAVLWNGGMFALATASGQFILRRQYRPLINANPRHRWMLIVWMMTYIFVGMQMGWVLRPFVGSPDIAPAFFRENAWTNAYVHIWRLLSGA